MFIQSETLGENVKLLHAVFQVLVWCGRERERERSLQGGVVLVKQKTGSKEEFRKIAYRGRERGETRMVHEKCH